MQRGNKILLVGIIILVSSAIIFGLSAYKAILMIENFPDITAKGIADKVTDKLADKVTDRINASAKIPDRLADKVTDRVNAFLSTSTDTEDTATQNVKEKLMIDVGILFFAIVSGIVLLINGLLAMIIGISIWMHDRRQ
jgi:hypothetical protein